MVARGSKVTTKGVNPFTNAVNVATSGNSLTLSMILGSGRSTSGLHIYYQETACLE